jgi:hypothetical protein
MLDNKFRSFEDKIQKQIDNKILGLETKLQKMEIRLQEMEKQSQEKKQSTQEGEVNNLENLNLRNKIKELEEKLNNNLALNSLEGKLDIKPIKEEMNKLIELDHEHNKRALNLIIFGLKEKKDEDTLALVKEELQNKLQIETTCLIEAKRLGKIIEHKDRLIHVKVSSNDHKYGILSKTLSLKGSRIFINEDLIPKTKLN